jgi:hypothetical protein
MKRKTQQLPHLLVSNGQTQNNLNFAQELSDYAQV